MAARLLIASEWKTVFEMETVQKQTKTHSLDGDYKQKMSCQAPSRKTEDKNIMGYFVTFWVKQRTFTTKKKKKNKKKKWKI